MCVRVCVCVCVRVRACSYLPRAASSVYLSARAAVMVVFIYAIDAAAAVVVADVAAVTQLLVVGPLLTEQLSKLI